MKATASRPGEAAIFDLDGVVTRTARAHAAAWKRLFDDYLAERATREGVSFIPFDADADYRRLVDGRPRYEGVRSFLASRGVSLPYGDPSDPPERETICGLGNRKNALFRALLSERGVEVFEGSVALIRALRRGGVATGLVSSSRNASPVLAAAGLTDLFDEIVDGVEAARLGLAGKPRPDTFREAARRLGVEPGRAAVVEDAIAGVEAGREGGFALVVGVARADDAAELRAAGADIVVRDLAEFGDGAGLRRRLADGRLRLPHALERFDAIRARLGTRRAAVFLDYDGTLSPIVDRPDRALLSGEMREAVAALAKLRPVAVVSGRDRTDVARLVGLEGLVYAGSHGFDISGPGGLRREHEGAAEALPALDRAEARLGKTLAGVEGALVERKKFAVAIHYRLVAPDAVEQVEGAVASVAAESPELRRTGGKKVFELRPRLDWDKGRAVLWLLDALGLGGRDVLPLYVGDDDTDEDAFRALEGRGLGVLVAEAPRRTAAHFRLDDVEEVRRFLDALRTVEEERA